jgi:3-oxoacyl-[acyl-carrier-protein] synthase II
MVDAGLNKENINPDRVGVVFASGIGGLITFQHEARICKGDGTPRFNPFFIPKMILDIAAKGKLVCVIIYQILLL